MLPSAESVAGCSCVEALDKLWVQEVVKHRMSSNRRLLASPASAKYLPCSLSQFLGSFFASRNPFPQLRLRSHLEPNLERLWVRGQ